MKRSNSETTQHVNPNLIPMIDIMFLLLLFFMLGADMGHRELEDVRLPKAEQAKEQPIGEKDRVLTFNAHHRPMAPCDTYKDGRICRDKTHWEIAYRGRDCTDPKILSEALSDGGGNPPPGDWRVMIRADAGAPFGLAQKVMLACAEKGIYKVELGAAKPRKD